MRYYIDEDIGIDTNLGTRELPFLTLQKGIVSCGISGDDEIVMSADLFSTQNIDLSVAVAPTIRIVANRGTRCTIDEIVPGSTRLMIQNGEWFFGVRASIGANSFDPAERSLLFDNATVHLDREWHTLAPSAQYVKPQVFYHCNIILNCAVDRHLFLCCEIDINDDSYWYQQSDFLYYHNRVILPEGMRDYRVPIYDKLGFATLMSDVERDSFYSRGSENRTSSFLYGTDALYAPLDSLNGIQFKTGPDVAGKVNDEYADDDWLFVFGDLSVFRDRMSLGTRIGTTVQNPAMIWMAVVDKRYGDLVYPTTSTGCYYRCIVGGTTDATEPALWPTGIGETVTDGTVTWLCIGSVAGDEPIAETYDTPNIIERYMKNMFDDAYMLNEKLLYLQGIMNSRYGAEGFSFNYERYGIDIKSVLAFNVCETWDVAGSMLGTMMMLECGDAPTGIYECNRRRNFPLGRLPLHYDVAAEEIQTHRRVTSWWSGVARQEWLAATDIRIGTILYVEDPGTGAWYEFECTGEGTTGALAPAWTYTTLDYVGDNTVTWRCFGPAATPSASATVDYEEDGLKEGLPVGGDTYNFRDLYAAYDHIHHRFDDDYTMAVTRQTNEDVISTALYGGTWLYMWFDTETEQYGHSTDATLKVLFDQYVLDLRRKNKVPALLARFENGIPLVYAAQVFLLWGGVIGYDPINYTLPTPVPETYVTWPNNVLSYATWSRGGFATTQLNSYRTDTILTNMFRQVFAVDTSLYRCGFIKDWFEYANKPVLVGQICRPFNAVSLKERHSFICVTAGTAGSVPPDFGTVAPNPGETVSESVVAPLTPAVWMNLGYMAFDWRQIENP